MMRTSSIAIVFAAGAAACTGVVATPSYQVDVAPILAARCVRCHGLPANNGAPPGFRLDGYPDTETAAGKTRAGAGTYARTMATRVSERTMPPQFPLDDDQIEVIARWAALTAVGPAPRGEPRPDDRAPTLVIDPAAAIYDLHDPDGDLVVGVIRAAAAAAAPDDAGVVVTDVHSGRDALRLDPARFAPGTYSLSADLDDGAGPFHVSLGTVDVP